MKVIDNLLFASVTEAKAKLPQLVAENRSTVLLRHNEPVAALVSISRYNHLLAVETAMRSADPMLLQKLRDNATRARNTPLADLGTWDDLLGDTRKTSAAAGLP
jgi:PHD/YefM family antitoxin component YafN of YafNO toxin-antitoxin module